MSDLIWRFGWSRNVAVGVMWTRDGKVAFMLLGLTLSRGLPLAMTAPTAPKRAEQAQAYDAMREALEAEEYAQRLANQPESQLQARVARERADDLRATALALANPEASQEQP